MHRYYYTIMNDIIQYIITFLLYGDSQAAQQVGYTSDKNLWNNYRIVIVPNGHLGAEIVLPDLSELKVEKQEATWVIHTDIIYNTFFFISRAEELINHQRDEHGASANRHRHRATVYNPRKHVSPTPVRTH